MSKNKSKRYWRAEVTFAHEDAPGKAKTSQVLGTKRENCEDCVKELEHFFCVHTFTMR